MLYFKIKQLSKKVSNTDWFGKNDLFIVIKYGEQIRRTSTLWNNNEPVWNEAFLFDVCDSELITLTIYDEDSWSKSEELKSYKIPAKLQQIKKYETEFLTIEMGNIHYELGTKIAKLENQLQTMESQVTEHFNGLKDILKN